MVYPDTGKLSIGIRGGGVGITKLNSGAKGNPEAKEYPPLVAFVELGQDVITGRTADGGTEIGPLNKTVVNPSAFLGYNIVFIRNILVKKK
jgi:hypothetical protein